MNGIITEIQRFCVHDGPGIRTTVFFKGCQLRCGWCHNPEAIRPRPELQVLPDKCIACGACLDVCRSGAHAVVAGRRVFRRERCAACGACAKSCYAGALVLVGHEVSAQQVVDEVLEDQAFYSDSGGGVTLSGGEPLLQPDFACEILRLCRQKGIHAAVETNVDWPWQRVQRILPWTDLIMADIKTMDPALHADWTGQANERILANAQLLSAEPVQLIIRTPVIPGVNDTGDQVGRIADFVAPFANLLYYELLPYHPLGSPKYHSLGRSCRIPDDVRLDPNRFRELVAIARRRPIRVRPTEC